LYHQLKETSAAQHIFSCGLSIGPKEFQITCLWKKYTLLLPKPRLS